MTKHGFVSVSVVTLCFVTAYIQLSMPFNVNAEIIVPNVDSVQNNQEQQQQRSSRLLQQNRKKQHLRAHNAIPQWQGSGTSWLSTTTNNNYNSKSNKSKSSKSKSNKSSKSVIKSNEQQHDIESVPTTKPSMSPTSFTMPSSQSITTLPPSSSEQHQPIDDLTCDEPMQLFQKCTFSSPDFEMKSEKCFGNGSPEVPGCYAEAVGTSSTCDDLCTMMDECAMDECNFIGCEKEVSFKSRSLEMLYILLQRYLLIIHPSTPLSLSLS